MKMNIEKTKAIELIDKKVKQFKDIRESATYENRYDEAYNTVYRGSEALIEELFSSDTRNEFRRNVIGIVIDMGLPIDKEAETAEYKGHIQKCITELGVYRGRIQDFWKEEKETQERPQNTSNVNISGNNNVVTSVQGDNNITNSELKYITDSFNRIYEKIDMATDLSPIVKTKVKKEAEKVEKEFKKSLPSQQIIHLAIDYIKKYAPGLVPFISRIFFELFKKHFGA